VITRALSVTCLLIALTYADSARLADTLERALQKVSRSTYVKNASVETCEKKQAHERERCFNYLAQQSADPRHCSQIPPTSQAASNCYFMLAQRQENEDYCQHLDTPRSIHHCILSVLNLKAPNSQCSAEPLRETCLRVLAVSSHDLSTCAKLISSEDRWLCSTAIARGTRHIEICDQLPSDQRDCYGYYLKRWPLPIECAKSAQPTRCYQLVALFSADRASCALQDRGPSRRSCELRTQLNELMNSYSTCDTVSEETDLTLCEARHERSSKKLLSWCETQRHHTDAKLCLRSLAPLIGLAACDTLSGPDRSDCAFEAALVASSNAQLGAKLKRLIEESGELM